ncbi:MAG: GNAT family N-acetyltransferase [Thermodesulfovibrionales bacterium]
MSPDRGPVTMDVILRDGQALHVRPISPGDRKKLEELFYRLSPRTRYLRFGFEKKFISEEELEYYTRQAPPERYACVGIMGEGPAERIVAVARWFQTADPATAEVAFVVEDNIQARGIGTALLEQLAAAAARHRMRFFIANVLPENTTMLEVFDESGFRLAKRLEDGLYHYRIDLKEQAEFSKRQAYREHIARSAGVRRMLFPRSIAVVGASRNPESVGGAVFRNLIQGGYKGTVFPVNPKAASISGVLAYPSVLDVPGNIDVAVIVVPARTVLDVVDECGRKGVWGLVIITAGFGEAGEEGRELERKLKEKVLSYGMRVIGPNCLGVLNADPEINMNATFSPIAPPAGNLSIGTQSGALGLALLDYAHSINLGLARFVSIGNRIDISSNDLLEFWEDDDATDIVLLYLESFGNPRKFSRIARRVSRKKPVIAVKAGKSAVGARAATSHTGALAASDVAVDAMFRQAGVTRVVNIEEMFNVARALAYQPAPKGPRVGILTNAGGPGVLASDACEGWGLVVPELSEETKVRLRAELPAEASVSNPVDMLAAASPEAYGRALSIMLEDPGLDAVIVIYIPPLVTRPEDVSSAIAEALKGYAGEKTVLACFMILGKPAADLSLGGRRFVPMYTFPEDAVQALARAYQHHEHRSREEGVVPAFGDVDADRTRKRVFEGLRVPPGGIWLLPETAMALLADYGIQAVETRTAASAEEAAEKAAALGFPVVMKVNSTTIVHKTDVGGIALGLRTRDEVRQAFSDMTAKLDALGLSSEMQGVVVQPMLRGGQEVIVGMSQDPVFGPLVMVGLGGIHVELVKDIAFSLHPLTDLDPERMLASLKGRPLLEGWRGNPRRDLAALKDVLLRFSALVEDFPEIDQMEINPLLVFPEGGGCSAVDARIFVKPPEPEGA